jgi:sigma-E factor negative regulatory protein RseB
MRTQTNTHIAAACLALCGFFTAGGALADPDATPEEWLDRMHRAVQTTNYEGMVIRLRDGKDETFKVVHTVSDGIVREKVIKQDGDGLEIIRNGNEVLCIFPERESVLVEEWNNQSTLFSTLPSSRIRAGGDYDVLIKGFDRVAGRKAVRLAVLPHDEFRYSQQVWLDVDTGFPLKTQLHDTDSRTLQLVKFADIRIRSGFLPDDLASSYVTKNWKWTDVSHQRRRQEIETDWFGHDLPRGFGVISTRQEILPGTDERVTHILYSDGLAMVSVFISADTAKKQAKRSRIGASNSYSTVVDGYRVTAVGEVPEITVEQIAKSMRQSR